MSSILQENYIPLVLCAGFGTRLKPLTNYMPKVVCPLIDKPFAFYNIEKFFKAGFKTVHCNVHYLPEIVKLELISACEFFGYDSSRIRFWHEENILETGGGVTRIFKELCQENSVNEKKDLIIVSGDIVADFPLQEMLARWETKDSNELALMCTKNMKQFRKDATYVSEDLTEVLGFGEIFANENSAKKSAAKVFTNHQIVSGSVVGKCEIEKKSSIDSFYRTIINSGKKIINFNYSESLYWFNIGSAQEYLECIQFFIQEKKQEQVNYAFFMPDNLKHIIKIYLNNKRKIQAQIGSGKVIIAFKQSKDLGEYISLNEVFEITDAEDIIYLYV
ncbi:MAG: sugar phosphate nucleotidyltransferase [Bdellovibrionota bacterium]